MNVFVASQDCNSWKAASNASDSKDASSTLFEYNRTAALAAFTITLADSCVLYQKPRSEDFCRFTNIVMAPRLLSSSAAASIVFSTDLIKSDVGVDPLGKNITSAGYR